MGESSPELRLWRAALLDWLTENPAPHDRADEADGVAVGAVVIVEHMTPDDNGPWLHHGTAAPDGNGLPTWREEGFLRSALRDCIARQEVDTDA